MTKSIDSNETIALLKTIQEHTQATFKLAQAMHKAKDKYGRKTLVAVTPYDVSFINYLCQLGSLDHTPDDTIAPQAYYELLGQPDKTKNKILAEVKANNLKPSEVRKKLRTINTKVVTKEKKVKTNNLARLTILLQNELKGMPEENKLRAETFIKQQLLSN